jgi:23S rRNA (adenine2503-C2)-methyltransferase
MSNLTKTDRESLKNHYSITKLEIVKKQVSLQDGTTKYLFQLSDGELIESVLMKYRHGTSACLSTQVGCAMGCSFCASGQEGLIRNLTTGEMLDQIIAMSVDQSERISHVVLMGSGEPLQNLQDVVKLINIMNHKAGLHISMRHITLSTCGLIPEINQLAVYELPITLAVSLHAASDEVRRRLMPIARRYAIQELVEACDAYAQQTGRRVTYEYALIKGVNDSVSDMTTLAALLKNRLCHVNLIPINPVEGSHYLSGSSEDLKQLKDILESKGIPVTVRREMGSDIDAACGQLKRRTQNCNEGTHWEEPR